MPGPGLLRYLPTLFLCPVLTWIWCDQQISVMDPNTRSYHPGPNPFFCLCTSYAMSGTCLAYRPITLCTDYEMSGTDLSPIYISLCTCYEMYGTDVAYRATRQPVQIRRLGRLLHF